MASYLDRYQSGDREQVWAELTALDGQVRQEPILPDAFAVACETMTRAGENVRRIVSRLQTIGYEFGGPASDQSPYLSPPYEPPPEHIKPNVTRMERETGPWPRQCAPGTKSAAAWTWPASIPTGRTSTRTRSSFIQSGSLLMNIRSGGIMSPKMGRRR